MLDDNKRCPHVLVVGDVMLDRYTIGQADRTSPEAPVMILRAISREVRLGGASNVAANCRALQAKVSMVGLVGADSEAATIAQLLREQGIDSGLIVDEDRCTTAKDRILGHATYRMPQQILRLDSETVTPPTAASEQRLCDKLSQLLPDADLVLVSDYGKGVCTPQVLTQLIASARSRSIPVLVDPARGADWGIYQGASLIKPNRTEAERATGFAINSRAEAEAAAALIARKWEFDKVAITLDQDGILLHMNGVTTTCKNTCRFVTDVTGAGDTVFAVLGVAIASGLPVSAAIHWANIAGGIQVERQGATTVSWEDIQQTSSPNSSARKIVSREGLESEISKLRAAGRQIVFTNGCFDLLHPGHVTCLESAANLGDVLVVAINTDSSVSRLKGPSRPINPAHARASIVAALECVDYVVLFDEDTPVTLLQRLRPDVLVKGGDYGVEQVVGHEVVFSYGGRVVVTSLVPGVSTTQLLERRSAIPLPSE